MTAETTTEPIAGDGPDAVRVARWRRFGHDRLYAKGADDLDLGYWDLKTDEAHPSDPSHLVRLTGAVARWKREQAGSATSTSAPLVSPPAPPAPAPPDVAAAVAAERPWVDLATNLPAEGVRDMAVAAFQAAPVKSVLARVLGVHTDERAWRIGADGEERVAAKLEKVARRDPRWRFLHSIPVGTRGSDIDHLAIGPGGVFTINTKHHPNAKIWVGGNTFLVDGHKTAYVPNARHEAARAARLLSQGVGFDVPVQGLVVTVNPDELTIKSQPEGVHVVPRTQVARWLLRLGPSLADDQIDVIYGVARRSTTWRS